MFLESTTVRTPTGKKYIISFCTVGDKYGVSLSRLDCKFSCIYIYDTFREANKNYQDDIDSYEIV